MAIQVSNSQTKPAITYDKVHLVDLRVNLTEEQDPIYSVRVIYKLYGIDVNGVKYFDKPDYDISIPDYLSLAQQKYSGGDADLLIALTAIESALATIVEDQGNHGTTTVL